MLEIIIVIAVLAVDQVSKYWTELYLSPVGTSYPLWQDVFHLTYTQNRGAAWGLMQGRRTFFIVITLIVCAALLIFIVKYRKRMHWVSRVSLALIFSGAIGNLIDRLLLSYVRDMFDFCLIQFPVFNIADSALTIGSLLLAIDVLFLKEKSIFALFESMPVKKNVVESVQAEATEETPVTKTEDVPEGSEKTHVGDA